MEIHHPQLQLHLPFPSRSIVASSGSHSPPTPQLPNSTVAFNFTHTIATARTIAGSHCQIAFATEQLAVIDTSSSSKLNIRDTTSPTSDWATSHFYPVFARSTGEDSHLQRQGDCETFVFFGGGGELSWKYVYQKIYYLSVYLTASLFFVSS